MKLWVSIGCGVVGWGFLFVMFCWVFVQWLNGVVLGIPFNDGKNAFVFV